MLDLEGSFWSAGGFSHSSCSRGSGEGRNRATCAECTRLFQINPEWVQRGGRSLATCIRLDSENIDEFLITACNVFCNWVLSLPVVKCAWHCKNVLTCSNRRDWTKCHPFATISAVGVSIWQ